MRAKINPPSLMGAQGNYQAECQFAIEPSVVGLLDRAEEAGWDRQQAAFAILALTTMLVDQRLWQKPRRRTETLEN